MPSVRRAAPEESRRSKAMAERAAVMTCYLYRCFNATGELLYVGVAQNALTRLGQHGAKGWALDVVSVTVGFHPSRSEALDAEWRAIRDEKPKHNLTGSNWRGQNNGTPCRYGCTCGRHYGRPYFPELTGQDRRKAEELLRKKAIAK